MEKNVPNKTSEKKTYDVKKHMKNDDNPWKTILVISENHMKKVEDVYGQKF